MEKAAIVHQLVTSGLKIQPGQSYREIYTDILSRIKKYMKEVPALAFPVGISVNEIAAHDSCFGPEDTRTIPYGSVVKIDIGIHYDGYIIDCAKTFIIPTYEGGDLRPKPNIENLVKSTREATSEAIKMFRPGTHTIDISERISEVIKSYDGISPMVGIGGHSIDRWTVHSGVLIPCVPNYSDVKTKIRAKQQYAVETFASTGSGKTIDITEIPVSHYMLTGSRTSGKKNEKELAERIFSERKTLPFSPFDCPYILDSKMAFKRLENDRVVQKFCALGDKSGTFTSQHEHTIWVTEEKTVILSEGSFSIPNI